MIILLIANVQIYIFLIPYSGNFQREKFLEILEKTYDFRKYISEMFFVLVAFRNGSLEYLKLKQCNSYNGYLFRMALSLLPIQVLLKC